MAQFPGLLLWTDAWVADTKHLSRLERGTYLDLLVLMWRTPGCRVPNDDEWPRWTAGFAPSGCHGRGSFTVSSPFAGPFGLVVVAPPWGHALSDRSGLDLRRTQPPVPEVIDITTDVLGNNKLLFAVQVSETVEPDSLAEVTAQFPWSAMTVYDINAAGQNHGLLLATWGWAAT